MAVGDAAHNRKSHAQTFGFDALHHFRQSFKFFIGKRLAVVLYFHTKAPIIAMSNGHFDMHAATFLRLNFTCIADEVQNEKFKLKRVA